MAVNFKLFKLYTRIYYNFILGKINNSIPKLNINISGIELSNKVLIISGFVNFPGNNKVFHIKELEYILETIN